MAIEVLTKANSDLRAQVALLHDRLVRMHGMGVADHERALHERVNAGDLEIERMREKLRRIKAKKTVDENDLDVDSILAHDMDKSVPAETFSAPTRPVKPDPESVVDE